MMEKERERENDFNLHFRYLKSQQISKLQLQFLWRVLKISITTSIHSCDLVQKNSCNSIAVATDFTLSCTGTICEVNTQKYYVIFIL